MKISWKIGFKINFKKEIGKMEEIIIASGNQGKIKETQGSLRDFRIVSMEDIGIDIDVKEKLH